MIEVGAITSGRNMPSSRYRIRQNISPLLLEGVRVKEFCPLIDKWAPVPGKPQGMSNRAILPLYGLWQGVKLATRIPAIVASWTHEITWLSRELLPGYSTLEGMLASPLVADVDDAIWLTPPFGRRVAERLARRSELMIVGNDYLADWFSQFSQQVHVVPTAIDLSVYNAAVLPREEVFTVGWIGSQGNLRYLEAIEDSLFRFFRDCPQSRLLVMSDRKPVFRRLSDRQVEFQNWSESNEIVALQRIDVGLMPLDDSDWARGKCSFKMLQYMAMEKPVVVSPVGMNRNVLAMGEVGFAADNPDEWYEILGHLHQNREECKRLGRNGRKVVEAHFERQRISRQIAMLFKSL